MAADLDSLITSEIPEGRQNLMDSHTNLERVAEYCENNYFQSDNKRAALEETKSYTTQSLASVAYQINTLAYNFLQMLDLQSSQIQEMESQINHISQTVSIHKEKVARREIGVLTTNKCSNRQYKIIAPANPERPIKYVRKPIDYGALDDIGHGVKVAQHTTPRQVNKRPPPNNNSPYAPGNQFSGQYGPGRSQYGSVGNVSQASAGPAPTTKPPTPPQARFQSGTLTRNKGEYRTPPVVAPPQVPSNYAPNYPKSRAGPGGGQQYGTLPHQPHGHGGPQVGMVYPQPQEGGGATMPRLSSHSMRSTHSAHSGGTATPPLQDIHHGITRKASTSSGDMDSNDTYGILRQNSQSSSVSRQSSHLQHAPNPVYGQYGVGATPPRGSTPPSHQYGKIGQEQRGSTPPSLYGKIGGGAQAAAAEMRGSTPSSLYGRIGGPTASDQSGSNASLYGKIGAPVQQIDQIQMQQQQLSSTPPSQYGIGGRIEHQHGSTPPSQYGMTRPSARPPSPPPQTAVAPSGMPVQQAPPGNAIYARQRSAETAYKRQPSESSVYSTRSQMSDQTYSSRGQLQGVNYSRQSSSTSMGSSNNQQIAPAQDSSGASQSGVVVQDMSLPGWVPKNYLEKVLAIYDYNADKEDELTFTEGQTIYVLKKNDDGWWEGVMDGITGLFPGNYVEQAL